MTDTQIFLATIQEILEGLLIGKVGGQEFVNRYEDLMADNRPDEIDQSGAIYRILDDYWMQFSFFQDDPGIRSEHPTDLYGREELRRKAQSLLEELRRLQKGSREG